MGQQKPQTKLASVVEIENSTVRYFKHSISLRKSDSSIHSSYFTYPIAFAVDPGASFVGTATAGNK